ncbi:MAG: GDP-fucose synthetase [Bdellovibrio sp. CG10_big_fil_rev_8_21_14_0_10_47_8]|nr:MAG: GDP-fucose synthetase [Bdellovibrio sp. CG10_big_fil_rev_8_21_14_0_10_47_8]
MKILVTGGRGMVGRNLVEALKNKDHQVVAPSRSELDLTDYKQVEAYIRSERPDMIVQTAGRVGGIEANMNHPVAFFLENWDINRNIIWSARQGGIKKMINLGSSCMYPKDVEGELVEEMILSGPLEPTNEGYAIAKSAAARFCAYIAQEDPEYRYKTIVPCNLYGRHDKFDPQVSHLLPAIVDKIHKAIESGSNEVSIWGTGEARREFLFAGDLADLIIYSLENFERMPMVMNAGPDEDMSINSYYQIAAEVMGFRGQFVHDLSKPVGMKQKKVSTEKLKKFGWKPKTDLRRGIALTYEFYKQSLAEKTLR